MAISGINLQKYLDRINFEGVPVANLKCLQALVTQHVRTIPFENATSFLGSPVNIELSSIEAKLIEQKRGGYCYEHNALLGAALRQMGFKVTDLAARVLWQMPIGHQAAQSHMILMVELEGSRFLIDVGFGSNTLTAPLNIDSSDRQSTPHGVYRFTLIDDDYLLEVTTDSGWQPMYSFDLKPKTHGDYKIGNWYCSTHPESRFVKHLIVARSFPEGRHTLFNRQLSYQPLLGSKSVVMLADFDELRATLLDVFGIKVPAGREIDQKLGRIFELDGIAERVI
ncbi:arylamine N-acetyltransferase [Microbulbifer sp. VAAF005]|uniref:arylamine N-acetyltransferase family protein n=1 Tax=Microbulbifer sp. VAAF005 TaxID=3034230 RepID=UPI0024ACA3C1|nr:arylamine N-acetyltransferase [Microbulbifer sp. VAAF005]WHI47459.1 arylamine N-acetyltransferase [Microbulbifer sp. VAAF005]